MDNLKIIHCGIRKPGFSDHLESIILEEQIYNLKGLRIAIFFRNNSDTWQVFEEVACSTNK